MSYLNRDERREVILQAAMRVALEEGFTAMTVRRIATEAQVSTGGASSLYVCRRVKIPRFCATDPYSSGCRTGQRKRQLP